MNTGNFGGLFDDKKRESADVEVPVVAYARRTGFMADKFTSPSRRSVPDYLFTVGFFCFLIEFKHPDKKCEATPGQAKDHAKRRKNGTIVFVCNDLEEGKKIIDRMWAYASDLGATNLI